MATSKQQKRKGEGSGRLRGAWIVGAIAVLGVCVGLVWWKGQSSDPTVETRRAGDSAPYPTELPPAEQERALRTEQLRTVEELVAAFPQSDDAVYLLGLVHNDQGDTATAMKFWQRSLELDPSRA